MRRQARGEGHHLDFSAVIPGRAIFSLRYILWINLLYRGQKLAAVSKMSAGGENAAVSPEMTADHCGPYL